MLNNMGCCKRMLSITLQTVTYEMKKSFGGRVENERGNGN